MTSVIKDPVRLRNKIIFWAVANDLHDLLSTNETFIDNLLKANIRPESLTPEEMLNLVLSPRKTICESDLPTKVIVSENVTAEDIQVSAVKWPWPFSLAFNEALLFIYRRL